MAVRFERQRGQRQREQCVLDSWFHTIIGNYVMALLVFSKFKVRMKTGGITRALKRSAAVPAAAK